MDFLIYSSSENIPNDEKRLNTTSIFSLLTVIDSTTLSKALFISSCSSVNIADLTIPAISSKSSMEILSLELLSI